MSTDRPADAPAGDVDAESRGARMWSQVSSKTLPLGERFDWFEELVSREVTPTDLRTDAPADFEAEAAVLPLGDVRMAAFAFSPLRSRRTPALIRRGDPEQYQLGLIQAGTAAFTQHHGDCHVFPGDLVLWDTSRPYEAQIPAETGPVRLLMLQLPRHMLPLRGRHADRLLAGRLPGDHGTTAVLAAFLNSLEGHAARCAPDERDRLGTIAVDLLAAGLAQRLGAEDRLPAEVRTQALLRRAHAFLDAHLGDPDLTPATIAAALAVSVRTLHEAFRGTGQTVAARIRDRRLRRSREDLARTGPRAYPVAVIAARWGFSGPAVFSRSFKEAYGMTPTEFRALSVKETRTRRTLP
ncbi:helix-turn-helix domain-containing protein [Streptomyces termitum]|uniref:AraC-like ligand-binding domain-containing protein n=1 Tax=Streptomyces termitum TaxID=67368 RepID=UPI0033B76763